MISSGQIKAARAMLDWSQDTLAQKSGLSLSTIHNLESGHQSPRSAKEVRRAFENHGFTFDGLTGLNQNIDKTKIYKGADSCDKFYADIMAEIKEKGGPITVIATSQEAIIGALDETDSRTMNKFQQLEKFAAIKCIIPSADTIQISMPRIELRAVPRLPCAALSLMTYGHKTSYIIDDGQGYLFIVTSSAVLVSRHRDDFYSLWADATPITNPKNI